MPFTSKSQMAACFAKKARGEAGGWNCKEWAEKTKNPKALPEHVKKHAAFDITLEPEAITSFEKIANKIFNQNAN